MLVEPKVITNATIMIYLSHYLYGY